jgi:hypothetical protein
MKHIICNLKFGSHLLFINKPEEGSIAQVPRKGHRSMVTAI